MFVKTVAILAITACIWTYGTDLRGRKVEVEGLTGADLVVALLQRETPAEREREHRELAARAAGTTDRSIRNDYAVSLMYVRRPLEAVEILRKIEAERPGHYVTAANLGTAYELSGDNVQALHWIREGIGRNRAAHNGSEWLHVRILEAKIALEADPQWLTGHSVVGLDFGDGVVPVKPTSWPKDNDGKPALTTALESALSYQLDERLEFVNPPDPVVADLLFDWANLSVVSGTLETAEALYLQALHFGVAKRPLAQQRLANVQKLLKTYKARKK